MSSNPPSSLVRPRLPRGFGDRGPVEIGAANKMLDAIRASYELHGFEAVETPFLEYTEALGKFLPDTDRPNEGVFSTQDDDEQWMSLRYDLTAPLARYVAENFDKLPKPYRSYRVGWVFRNEKPGPGRFRQFMQFDADTVGSASVAADAEICMMAADTLERLGVKRGDYVIKVSNRKLLDGLMEGIGLGGVENTARRLTVLRAIDKFDRLGLDGVRLLLGAGRKDESGDFTKGAGLDDGQIDDVTHLLAAPPANDLSDAASGDRVGNQATIDRLRARFPKAAKYHEGLDELEKIADIVSAAGFDIDRVRIDPSVVRGLEYYTGPVYEAELIFEVKGEDGRPVRFGSVGGGGRYDGLVARFRAEPVPATGFSIGVSRLFSALKAMNSPLARTGDAKGPVVVLAMDKDQAGATLAMVQKLRAANIAAEMYLGAAGMNAQLKYADRRRSPCAVIQGSNEREKGEVAIRDLVLGAELATGTKDRADYLELRQKAQFSVPEAQLIDAVREVLARHAK